MRYRPCCSGGRLVVVMIENKESKSTDSLLSMLLDVSLSIITTTSLLPLQQGQYLIWSSSQSQATLPSKRDLSLLLEAL